MRILVGTDGSEAAASACRFLRALPLPEGTRIRLVSVIAPPAPLVGPLADGVVANWAILYEVEKAEEEAAAKAADDGRALLERPGVDVETEVRRGDPARELIAAADAWNADLVVVGSRGLTGLERVLLGSVAANVARHCRRPVLVGREPRNDLREAILGTDGSERARHAAQFLARFPLPPETRVTVVHVLRLYDPFPGILPTDKAEFRAAVLEVRQRQEQEARALVEREAAPLREAGRRVETEVRYGSAADALLELAEERRADLIALGARGVSLIEGLLVGSVADRVLREAACSVLIVH